MRSHAFDSQRRDAGTIVLDPRRGVRARAWGTRPGLAHLVVADHTWSPPADDLRAWIDHLTACGFDAVRTGALADAAAEVFLDAGFAIEQSLALLRIDPCAHRPARRRDRHPLPIRTLDASDDLHALAAIDQAAFGATWGIDEGGIIDACLATPAHRLRVVDDVAFAVTGRAGSAGFLQRLAVHPDHQGEGLGRDLVHDSLGWLRRRRVRVAMVNTHTDNDAALALYASVGFERLPAPLQVLIRQLGRASLASDRP